MARHDNDFSDDEPSEPRLGPLGIPIKRIVIGIAIGLAVLFGFIFAAAGFHTVDSTERAVVFHQDGSLSIVEPGKFIWITPVITSVQKYDVRSVAYTASAVGLARDQQVVTTEVTVLYHPAVDKIQTIHQTLGTDYETKVVVPAVQDSVKSAVNFYTVEQLRGETRDQVRTDIINRITSAVEAQNLVVDQISLTDFDFSETYNAAIEAAATAERRIQEAEANFRRAQVEANQTVVTAQAQAEAARLLSASNSEQFFRLKWLEKWNGILPTYLGGGNEGVFLAPPAPT